ncbi:hypothetical protein GCM10025857_29750 [Alicyclobacillus contaminans]|nr:hypothetical protein GCM10025857_29750 [Alicyclobacillus contaminans]
MARFIHGLSLRSAHPFVGINCGAISESLLESELFGHERGAFTGAMKPRRGFFELADSGTLFLDEIGEAPMSIQVKLLRVLETGEFMRVGGEQMIKANVRVVAATNRSLEFEATTGRFREDLLYRIEGIKLTIPALRDRPNDIPAITRHYLSTKLEVDIDEAAMQVLTAFDWPGNVRQLINVLNQIVAVHDCPVIREQHLPAWLRDRLAADAALSSLAPSADCHLEREMERFVDSVIHQVGSVDELDFRSFMKKVKKLEVMMARRLVEKGLSETGGNRKVLSQKWNVTPRMLRYILNERQS